MKNIPNANELRSLFNESFRLFLKEDLENIVNGVSERNLCQRLSMHLEKVVRKVNLRGFWADTEYNRNNDGRLKTIVGENLESITITCDLILHIRGMNAHHDNLMAIEMKRSTRPQSEKNKDRIRIMALTRKPFEGVWSEDGRTDPVHVCDYIIGYFIELNVSRRNFNIEEYRRGDLTKTYQITF